MSEEQGMLGNLQPKWLEGRCAMGGVVHGRQVMSLPCRALSVVPRKWVLYEDSGSHCESEAREQHKWTLKKALFSAASWNTDLGGRGRGRKDAYAAVMTG